MPEISPQRLYKAVCPNCGADVAFASSASTHAICGYCRSSLAREGELLIKLGEVAEVFEDYSPLQLGTTGKHVGANFTVVGRLQYSGDAGAWNEWRIAFDDGRAGWLSEDNGRYVLGVDPSLSDAAPAISAPRSHIKLGVSISVAQQLFDLNAIVQAKIHTAQGELPKTPAIGQTVLVAEGRNPEGLVASLEYKGSSEQPASFFISRPVELSRLQLQNLRELVEKTLAGKNLECPNCGSNLSPKLGLSKAITCVSCKAIVNLQAGASGQQKRAFEIQDSDVDEVPTLPLGRSGMLKGVQWQIVGYQQLEGISNEGGEAFTWAEYVLYNRAEGFAFLIESSSGWVFTRTCAEAPSYKNAGRGESYTARTTFVLGEFYWPVSIDQKSFNTDYQKGATVLSREQTGTEIIWSQGFVVSSLTIGRSFGVKDERGQYPPIPSNFEDGDQGATSLFAGLGSSQSSGAFWAYIAIALVILLILWTILKPRNCYVDQYGQERCTASSGRGYFGSGGSSSGSWGGSGGGGGHK